MSMCCVKSLVRVGELVHILGVDRTSTDLRSREWCYGALLLGGCVHFPTPDWCDEWCTEWVLIQLK